jgi:hypothetical protein
VNMTAVAAVEAQHVAEGQLALGFPDRPSRRI